MSGAPIAVLKLGSSVLKHDGDIPAAVAEICRVLSEGFRVVAVVSAVGRTTESLLRRAAGVSPSPDPSCTAELLATGERASAALLTLALRERGVPAASLDPLRARLAVEGSPLDARPVSVDIRLLRTLLEERFCVVVPGFFGCGPNGDVRLLGRGGSDLTAVFIAASLDAALCRLLKDVDGVYDCDPASGRARRYDELSWDDALALGAKVIQPKALELARRRELRFEVAAPGAPAGTGVGRGPSRLAASPREESGIERTRESCGATLLPFAEVSP